jgi:hypothetical protein
MLRYGWRSYNFLVSKVGKNSFLVRYGSREIAFLTLIPYKWCGIFQNDRRYGTLRYATVRYCTLRLALI